MIKPYNENRRMAPIAYDNVEEAAVLVEQLQTRESALQRIRHYREQGSVVSLAVANLIESKLARADEINAWSLMKPDVVYGDHDYSVLNSLGLDTANLNIQSTEYSWLCFFAHPRFSVIMETYLQAQASPFGGGIVMSMGDNGFISFGHNNVPGVIEQVGIDDDHIYIYRNGENMCYIHNNYERIMPWAAYVGYFGVLYTHVKNSGTILLCDNDKEQVTEVKLGGYSPDGGRGATIVPFSGAKVVGKAQQKNGEVISIGEAGFWKGIASWLPGGRKPHDSYDYETPISKLTDEDAKIIPLNDNRIDSLLKNFATIINFLKGIYSLQKLVFKEDDPVLANPTWETAATAGAVSTLKNVALPKQTLRLN